MFRSEERAAGQVIMAKLCGGSYRLLGKRRSGLIQKKGEDATTGGACDLRGHFFMSLDSFLTCDSPIHVAVKEP